MSKRQPRTSKPPRKTLGGKPAKQVIVYFPEDDIPLIDQVAGALDLDRSKFIRRAVRAAMQD